ncbi:hypothetical protein PC128_g20211 [Phytophthora cactorum]|nr:hypothetical protein PC128_g20211 [Phytophthora cactorum]
MKTTRGHAMGNIAAKTTKLVATVGRSFDFEGSEDDGSEAEDNDLGYYGDWSEEAAESESSVKAVRVSGTLCAAWPSLRDDPLAMDEVLARCLVLMETNEWIGLFNTPLGWQTTRGKLWAGLNHPTKAGSIAQVVEEIVSLLLAMGLDILSYPSEFNLRKWSATEAGAELRESMVQGEECACVINERVELHQNNATSTEATEEERKKAAAKRKKQNQVIVRAND